MEWEATDERFALLTQDTNGNHNISFYSMFSGVGKQKKPEVKKLCNSKILCFIVDTVQNRMCNRLYWSPAGNYILFAGLGVSLVKWIDRSLLCVEN